MGHHRTASRRSRVVLLGGGLAVASALALTACTATTPAEVRRVSSQPAGAGTADAAELLDPHTLQLTLAGTADCVAEVVEARESADGEVVVETAGHAEHTCSGRAGATTWRINTAADLTAAGGPRPVVVYAADGLLTVPVGSAAG